MNHQEAMETCNALMEYIKEQRKRHETVAWRTYEETTAAGYISLMLHRILALYESYILHDEDIMFGQEERTAYLERRDVDEIELVSIKPIGNNHVGIRFPTQDTYYKFKIDYYRKTYRLWSKIPTWAERESVAWIPMEYGDDRYCEKK